MSFLCAMLLRAELSNGQIYALHFADVDGRTLSTGGGHVTVMVVATTGDWAKTRAVGDRVPDYCLGNPDYRMITILHFIKKHTAIGRKIATVLIRHRLNEEAKRLQERYNAKKIAGNARNNIFVAADFDETVSSELGVQPGSGNFRVFVFARNGELHQQWDDVPSAADLAAVLK